MGKFESATSYGEAVIRFWHDWRKVKSKDKKKAKREKMRSEKAQIQGRFSSHKLAFSGIYINKLNFFFLEFKL